MKKIIVITFILLIGLMILSGCTSTNVDSSANKQQDITDKNIEGNKNIKDKGSQGKLPEPPKFPE